MSMPVQTTYSDNRAIGYSGMLDSNMSHDILTMKNAEASASIAFGRAVKFRDTVTTDKDAVLPAAQADSILGLVVHSHAYASSYTDTDGTVHGVLDSVGVKPQGFLNILRRGRMLVTCETACEAGDPVFVRATAGARSVIGSLENAADAATMISLGTRAMWLTSASAGGLAWVDINL